MRPPLSLLNQVLDQASLLSEVATRFCPRPSLCGWAASFLDDYIAELHSALPASGELWLATPVYLDDETQEGFQGYDLNPLPWVLIDSNLRGDPLNLIQGWHFVTDQAGNENPRQLPIDMDELTLWLDEGARHMQGGFAQSLVGWWGAPDTQSHQTPWAWLADHLRGAMLREASSGLDPADAAALRALADRRGAGTDAGLLNIVGDQGYLPLPGNLEPALLIRQPHVQPGWERLILWAPKVGAVVFRDWPSMAHYISQAMSLDIGQPQVTLECRRFEGDAFEAMAGRVLEIQMICWPPLLELARDHRLTAPTVAMLVDQLTGLLTFDRLDRQALGKQIAKGLPGWLVKASDQDRQRYAEGLGRLALSRQVGDFDWLEGVPSLDEWTRKRLLAQMRVDWPEDPLPDIDELDLRLLTNESAMASVVSSGEGLLEEHSISLVRLAQLNRAGRPRGELTLHVRPGQKLPPGFDRDYVEQLVHEVDIGGNYLSLLRAQLQGPGLEPERRRQVFLRQWSIQLAQQALEHSLRDAHGFSSETAQMVAVAVGGTGEMRLHAIMRPLVLEASASQKACPTAVFVIGPGDCGEGPRVLYTPLRNPTLQAFTSMAALEDGLREEGELQRFVIDWLKPEVRNVYANGGLAQPHIVRFGQGDEFAPLSVPAPAAIREGSALISPGDAVHAALVEAMIDLADRRTVSNAESRWISFGALASALFEAVLPFVPGPFGVAGWVFGLLEQVGELLEQESNGAQQPNSPQALTGLLFNVSLFLFAEALHLPAALNARKSTKGNLTRPATERARVLIEHAEIQEPVPPSAPLLSFSWASARAQLPPERLQALRAMRQALPAGHGSPAPYGQMAGLYVADNALYVRLAEGDFQVAFDEHAQLRVVNPVRPTVPGPWLARDEAGRWRLDTRLRLLGGGDSAQALDRQVESLRAMANYESWISTFANDLKALDFTVNLIASTRASERPSREQEAQQLHDNFHVRLSTLIDRADTLASQLEEANRHYALRNYWERQGRLMKIRISLQLRRIANRRNQLAGLTKDWEAKKQAASALLQQPAYIESLRSRIGWLDEMLMGNRLVDQLLDDLVRIPRIGKQYREELQPRLEKLPSPLLWHRTRLSLMGVLGLHVAGVQAPEVAQAASNWLESALEMAHRYEQVLDEDAVRQQLPETTPIAERLAAANSSAGTLEQVLQGFRAAADGLAFARDGAPLGLLGQDFTALLHAVVALGDQVEASLQQVLERELRLRRYERKASRKAQRKLDKSQHRAPSRVVTLRKPVAEPLPLLPEEPVEQMLRHLAISPPATGVKNLMKQARTRLDGTAKLVQRVRGWVSDQRIPVEMEELLTEPARELDKLADMLEQASRQAVENPPAGGLELRQLVQRLRSTADELRGEGRQVRIETILIRPPTGDNLSWLLQQNEASIGPLGPEQPLKTGQGEGDRLREALINKRDGTPLWYAHFHYTHSGELVASHLKTAAQRFDGLGKQLQQAQAGKSVVAIWRGRLSEVQVRAMFPQALRS
ncbi:MULTISPECIES: hypothetical protein [unclassified Pseudomonas]|uniref:hypothetical protein n=1 Tax=unclassified Pseudomonas TaxID=196821 RepID=UPI000BDDC3E2|nr:MULTISPECIES: hypothetical protein [unclassified Pseudomonas]PVZ13505.1 hypothetical protein F474_02586 [Pseudomonas sp. URIL14HWK12:I12]PVZ23811.1 hypothetical protein F470_02241 [Pseudomonas sp. URIL14HWK12:I10]PVZ33550.1 hypothetical protein F472_03021 [Pseudomonas sp. URIL14HWK12:I11]SNZ11992.1 hypothetical protein SAMN05660463_02006 [Pseudomonas sp. URIL14HWK12:I9]